MQVHHGDLAVLITGGASGIGLATARKFLSEGFCHVAIADRSVELGGKLVEEWNAEYKSDCICLALDLADEASVEAVINEVVGRYGRLDIAVNCKAGIGGPTVLGVDLPSNAWHNVMAVDLNGCFWFTRAVIRYWMTQEPRLIRDDVDEGLDPLYQRGSLVNIASAVGSLALRYQTALVAAKHGVLGISRNFALEAVDHGIRGVVNTPIMEAEDFDIGSAKAYTAQQAFRRFAHPEEVASCVFFLCSDEASFCTGTNMHIDGGWSAH